MRDISFYLDAAIKKNGFKSDLELGRALNYKGSQIHYLRTKKSKISDAKMIELARLAGEDEATALMDLNMWRAPSPAVQSAYAKILHSLNHAAIVIIIAAFALIGSAADSHAHAFIDNLPNDYENNIYYGK